MQNINGIGQYRSRQVLRRSAAASVLALAVGCGSDTLTKQHETEERSAQTVQQTLVSSARANLKPFRQMAIDHSAKLLKREPAELDVSEGAIVLLPHLQRVLARFKVKGTAEPFGVDIDVATQQVVTNGPELVEKELSSAEIERGKLGESLRQRLTQAVTEPVNVVVWLSSKGDKSAAPVKTPVNRRAARLSKSLIEQAVAERAAATTPVRERMLKQLKKIDANARVDGVSPVAFARVPKEYLPTLQASSDVVEIDLDKETVPELNIVRDELDYVPEVHSNYGLDGTGQLIAQIESGVNVRINHECLGQVTQGSGGTVSSHAHSVAGVLICNDSTYTGLAPGAQLWLGSGTNESEIESALNGANAWGAKVFNMSFGEAVDQVPNSFDRFVDNMFWSYWVTVVKSAGNLGSTDYGCQGSSGYVTHPGLGYNVITVGDFNDNNTVERYDDFMDSCSSYKNPASAHSDRQKPEVAAPGEKIMTASSSGYGNASGTSISAPMVSGAAALMMHAQPILHEWPEIVKAALMATARFNLEGATRLSEYDGAGGIDVLSAVNLVSPLGPPSSDFYGEGVSCSSTFPRNYTFNLTANKRVRAVIVWHQDPNYTHYATQPGADLDLEIALPNGTAYTSSTSWDNTFEIAEFVAPVDGTYTARVTSFRCDSSPAYVGFAWYQEP